MSSTASTSETSSTGSTEPAARHIGIVLDGHRRHAREERLPTYTESYRVGMRRFEEFIGWAEELEIPAVTAWVLSRENLSRPAEELEPYFEVLVELFGRLPALCEQELRHGHQVHRESRPLPRRVGGRGQTGGGGPAFRSPPPQHRHGLRGKAGDRRCCQGPGGQAVADGTPPDEIGAHIDAESLASHMYSADLPDPDLLIRTSASPGSPGSCSGSPPMPSSSSST